MKVSKEALDRAVGTVAALPAELGPLWKRAHGMLIMKRGPLRLGHGEMYGRRVVFAVTGEGARLAEEGVNRLVETYRPKVVFAVGIAGALSPELTTGQVVVAQTIGTVDEQQPAPESSWVERFLAIDGVVAGRVLTHDRIVSTAAEKADLLRRAGEGGPTVVDLETTVYVRGIRRAGLPCVVLRVVCDTADQDLPIDFNRFVIRRGRREGAVSRSRILAHTLLHPGFVKHLLYLRREMRECSQALTQVIEKAIAE